MPAHLNLAAAEMELASEVGREVILRDHLCAEPDLFDYLIFDCPPSLGILTLNALTAVHEVFLPLQPHFLALHGLSKLLQTIQLVAARLNPQLKLSGVVMCMYDAGTRLAAEVCGDVEEFFQSQSQTTRTVGRGPKCSRPRSAAIFAWPKHPVSANRFSSMRRNRTVPKTIRTWPKRLLGVDLIQCRRRATAAAA